MFNFMKFRTATITVAATLLVAGIQAAPAAADAVDVPGTVYVCDGQYLSSLGPDGTPLPKIEITRMTQSIQAICDGPAVESGPNQKRGPVTNTTTGSNGQVTAYITSRPGVMTISGYAVGVNGAGAHELQCIYRQTGAWQSCGYGTGTTSITTSSVTFCPVPGLLFTASVTLYIGGVAKVTDTQGKYSL